MKKYDVFISYRRDGGDMTAARLYDSLKEKGYRVFLDTKELGACQFDERLKEVVQGCKDFILVLTQGSLDRCCEEKDWVRGEIEWAIQSGCRLIPVRALDFEFPQNMPEHLRILNMHNGPQISAVHWNSFVNQVCKDMRTQLFPWKRVLKIGAGITLAAAVGVGSYAVYQLIANGNTIKIVIDVDKQSAKQDPAEQEETHVQADAQAPEQESDQQSVQGSDDETLNQYYTIASEDRYAEALVGLERAYEAGRRDVLLLEWLGHMYGSNLPGIEPDYGKSVMYYEQAVAVGSTYAANNLASMYYEGKAAAEPDYERAFELYMKAAELDEKSARAIRIGSMYQNGLGVEKNEKLAKRWLETGMKNSDAQTLYNEGIRCAKDGDYATAEKLYQRVAEMAQDGDTGAMDAMGHIYYNGDLGEPDYAQAITWFEKVLEIGEARSCIYGHLSWMYNNGKGAEKNTDKAIEYSKTGAEKGNIYSTRLLGKHAYDEGDNAQALTWFKKAYELGDRDESLLTRMGNLYSKDRKGAIVDEEKAADYYQQAAEQGNDYAAMRLGWLSIEHNDYEQGMAWLEKAYELSNRDLYTLEWLGRLYCSDLVPASTDYEKGINYYQQAIEQGSCYAAERLGEIYAKGKDGIPVDEAKAEEYCLLAAERGSDSAPDSLGKMYCDREDYVQALTWFEKAYDLDKRNQYALEWLGYLYSGSFEAIPADYEKALDYCRQAADLGSSFAVRETGLIFSKMEDYPQALTWFEKAYALGDREKITLEWLGALYCNDYEGIPVDYEKGMAYYHQAVEQGSVFAAKRLGWEYLEQYDDYAQALTWFEKAYELGDRDEDTINIIAELYYDDYSGVTVDYEKAAAYYQEAADLGSGYAMMKIGEMHYYGEYFEEDKQIADEWFRKALAAGCEEAQDFLEE